ncbi:ketopantoate reductase family protein [Agrococcus jejuensis]|uniref:2-dehydropantoate 2-reductase n=1 Tax=Agrococcus jejuensis TaxID=399736 RepID=A0A1G8AQN2_9MICO|nr:2-dehydropantoate 2-reductase [Agrococcus jejuensis]SDH23268.1 ketopantoate reductase [Agrococcus jejuensis]
MRIAVLGAGAIGGCLAALLDAAGHDLVVVARSSAPVLRAHGIRLEGAFGTHHAHPEVVDALTEAPDVAILATKTIDSAAALTPSRAALADVPVLAVQNGLDAHGRVARILGHDRVAAGLGTWAANALEPGVVRITASGETVVGGPEGERFAGMLSGAMPHVRRAGSIEGAQWAKLCVNAVNAVPAAVGLSMQEVAAAPALLRVTAAAMREAALAAIASGVAIERVGSVGPETIGTLAASIEEAQAVPRRMAATFGDVPNLGSTQQSIRKGQPTEVDDLAGAIVEASARLGLDAPVNAGLVALVHEVERTGAFVAPERVAALAPLP